MDTLTPTQDWLDAHWWRIALAALAVLQLCSWAASVAVRRRATGDRQSLLTWLLAVIGPCLFGWLALRSGSIPPVLHLIAVWLVPGTLASLSSIRDRRRRGVRQDRRARAIVRKVVCGSGQVPPFALYLRSFATTGRLSTQKLDGESPGPYVDVEYLLSRAVGSLPMVAVGRLGEVEGAGRVPVADQHWQAVVGALVEAAELIVVVPAAAPGTVWEMQLLRELGKLDRTVFLMPEQVSALPDSSDDARLDAVGSPHWSHAEDRHRNHLADWHHTVEVTACIGITLPPYRHDGALFTLDDRAVPLSIRPLGLAKRAGGFRLLQKALAELRERRAPDPAPVVTGPVVFRSDRRPRRGLVDRMSTKSGWQVLLVVSLLLPSGWWLPLTAVALMLVLRVWRVLGTRKNAMTVVTVVDEDGLSYTDHRKPAGTGTARWTWDELSAVEIRSTPAQPRLTLVPAGRPLDLSGLRERAWNGEVFSTAGLYALRIDERRLAAALRHFAGGRYREPAPPEPEAGIPQPPPADRFPITEQVREWPARHRWLRERLLVRGALALVWASAGAGLLWFAHDLVSGGGTVAGLAGVLTALAGAAVLLIKVPAALRGNRLSIDESGITFRPAKPGNPTVFLAWSKVESAEVTGEWPARLVVFVVDGAPPPTGRPGVFRFTDHEISRHHVNGVVVATEVSRAFTKVVLGFRLEEIAAALHAHGPD
ncbi:hypothetical protein BBK82_30125 [Lentzea guizhouensis]|uniref:Uncharacterized protein n=1 Tax=Lentzea guizhouensis TaxID=1586287 RepID=A0A1B2HPM6_9PSEU|nr:hypothetical protein [Lentzea guizhouensis]ANZ39669.1 hypothetical protein BBK82_30125 [Lentzea guizhouensis]